MILTEWDASHGSGGSAGAGIGTQAAANGRGRNNSVGGQGLIVIQFMGT